MSLRFIDIKNAHLNCILEEGGDNCYKLPHMKKDRLERLGQLPTLLDVTDEAAPYLLEGLELT